MGANIIDVLFTYLPSTQERLLIVITVGSADKG